MVLVKTAPDVKYGLVTKVGSIQLPFDCQGRLLEQEIASATESFVRSMELRGWTLYRGLKRNPVWATDGDSKMAFYAIDWFSEYTGTKRAQKKAEHLSGGNGYQTRDAHRGPMPTPRERSLEETDGFVEYRCVGVFIAPETVIEVLGNSYERKQQEKAARNPVSFS